MWRWDFAILIIFSSLIDFFCGKNIYKSKNYKSRKLFLYSSLFCNLGLLLFFKYTYFVNDSIWFIYNFIIHNNTEINSTLGLNIILPLGISFYTFQTISYTIDIYRGVSKPEKKFIVFLSYVIFWPQLIAGPILRSNEVIPQLKTLHKFSWKNLISGIEKIIFGLFKKVVLADNIAIIVDSIYNRDISMFNATDVWIASILFGFQIYFDFSGYSDIAIGTAKTLGINFPENFKWPYISKSPKEFWTRWHISLSSWIRDYLYLPLTGQRFKTRSTDGISNSIVDKKTTALFFTWFIMGLWHGASWKFAFWGLYHAMFVYAFRNLQFLKSLPENNPLLGWLVTFFISMAGWIPFRAENLFQTKVLFLKILNPFDYSLFNYSLNIRFYFAALILFITVPILFNIHQKLPLIKKRYPYMFILGKCIYFIGLIFMVLVYLKSNEQFIYFQF